MDGDSGYVVVTTAIGALFAGICAYTFWCMKRAVRKGERFRFFWEIPAAVGLGFFAFFFLTVPFVPTDSNGTSPYPQWQEILTHCANWLMLSSLLLANYVQNERARQPERNRWLGYMTLAFIVGMNGRGWMQEKVLWNHDLDTILVLGSVFLWNIRARPQGEWW